MRDQFQWDRTTENFYRYRSDRAEPIDKVLGGRLYHYVVYVPRKGGPEVPPFRDGDFIISRMTSDQLEQKPYGEPIREPMLRPAEWSQAPADGVTRTGRGDLVRDYALWSKVVKLEERAANLEWLMSQAYQALEKLIAWYYKVKRRRRA